MFTDRIDLNTFYRQAARIHITDIYVSLFDKLSYIIDTKNQQAFRGDV
jgi:hypothetical protein